MFKVGDRVLIKKPAERHSKMGCCWQPQMDKYNGTVLTVICVRDYTVGVGECYWSFDFEWLSKIPTFKGNIK